MAYKHEDFHPVLPNITDDSMKDVDDEIPQQSKGDKNTKPGNNGGYDKKKGGGMDGHNSTGKKIIIGILVVIIIILIILLIYQIYIYYNGAEAPIQPYTNTPGGVSSVKHPPKPPDEQNTVSKSHNKPDSVLSTTNNKVGDLPQHVRDLDNDVLTRYIKKGGVSQKKRLQPYKEHSSAKHVEHNSMKGNTVEVFKHQSPDTDHIGKIIDITEESLVESPYIDDIPSREDDLVEMRKDMMENDSCMTKLHSIGEETEHDIIEDFMHDDYDDDIASIKSEGGGCTFELTKGKNRGQQCGRKRIDDSKCSRHKHK
jgi:hypothetical protein